MKKTYTGSCHCGAVRFKADIDLSEGTFKCNCSFCTKAQNWLTTVTPAEFRLLSGESDLTNYRGTPTSNHNLFCKHCGMRPFGWGEAPELGGKFYAINVACLDNAEISELVSTPIAYIDGRNDNYQSAPAEVRHL